MLQFETMPCRGCLPLLFFNSRKINDIFPLHKLVNKATWLSTRAVIPTPTAIYGEKTTAVFFAMYHVDRTIIIKESYLIPTLLCLFFVSRQIFPLESDDRFFYYRIF